MGLDANLYSYLKFPYVQHAIRPASVKNPLHVSVGKVNCVSLPKRDRNVKIDRIYDLIDLITCTTLLSSYSMLGLDEFETNSVFGVFFFNYSDTKSQTQSDEELFSECMRRLLCHHSYNSFEFLANLQVSS